MSQTPQRNPVVLGGIVVLFALMLGGGAYVLNQVVNPTSSRTSSTPSAGSSPGIGLTPVPTPKGSPTAVTACPAPPASHDAVANPPRSFPSAPAQALDMSKGYCAYMNTSKGMIAIRLRPDAAPLTVNNFVYLAKQGFYDGLTFHRVCPNPQDNSCSGGGLKIAQGGDPKGDGTGGPGYSFADEKVVGDYITGSIAMANSGPNTNGSQFFINTDDNSALPHNYNLFGQITAGLDVAKALVKGDKMIWVDIETTDAAAAASAPAGAAPASPTPAASPS